MDDEIISDTLITRGGAVVHPRVCKALGIEPPAEEDIAVEAETADEEDGPEEQQDTYGIKPDDN